MSRTDVSLDLRRAAVGGSKTGTPKASPRRGGSATPRKALRASATPGGAAGGTPSRTPSRRRLAGAAPPPRSRAARGVQSEPSSPRGASSGQLGLDALADPLLDELLPPGEAASGAPTPTAAAADAVRVYVRVRPPSAREGAGGGDTCVTVLGGGRSLALAEAGRPEPLVATFDRVFGPEEGQEALYSGVGAQMVEHVLAGFNSSIFVYGQTGAGKTHTITGDVDARGEDGGPAEQCGLTLRVFCHLFDRISDEEREGAVRYTVKCSYCEIYNEELADLLAPGAAATGGSGGGAAAAPGLAIRDGDAHRGVYVEGLSDHVAVNAEDVMRLVQRGAANRHTAATRMNERSSRSHSVFTAVVEAREEQGDSGVTCVRHAKMNLIDLAGSERVGKSGATGEQLTEAKNINKSLTTLGRVVTALTELQPHVPYRDSRLTFLLKESLGGNSKTSIVACVSPSADSAQESHGTLAFVSNAKKIRNRAVVNRDTLGNVRALQAENARLQRELAKREDVLAGDLRARLAAAEAAAAAAEERAAAAEGRQGQLEAALEGASQALQEKHTALQQRNAELALVRQAAQELEEKGAWLQTDRENMIDQKAGLAERVDTLSAALQGLQADATAAMERCEAAVAAQRAAEDAARAAQRGTQQAQHGAAQLEEELGRVQGRLAEAQAALAEAEQRTKALELEQEQLHSELRCGRRELEQERQLAARGAEHHRRELAALQEALAARTAALVEAEAKLAGESAATVKYRRMVDEIGKLVNWAQSTSPLPPTLGGRTSPAGFSSLLGGRLSFGAGSASASMAAAAAAAVAAASPLPSPLGDATNQLGSRGNRVTPLSASPSKRQLQVGSPAGRTPIASPTKMR